MFLNSLQSKLQIRFCIQRKTYKVNLWIMEEKIQTLGIENEVN